MPPAGRRQHNNFSLHCKEKCKRASSPAPPKKESSMLERDFCEAKMQTISDTPRAGAEGDRRLAGGTYAGSEASRSLVTASAQIPYRSPRPGRARAHLFYCQNIETFFGKFRIKIDIPILSMYTICVNLLPFGGNSLGKEVESQNSGTYR